MPTPKPDRPATDLKLSRNARWMWWSFLILAVILVWTGGRTAQMATVLSYSDFKAHLARGEARELILADEEIRGKLVLPDEGDSTDREPAVFRTVRVEDTHLIEELDEAGVEYLGEHTSTFFPLLVSWILPLAVMILIFRWIIRSAGGTAGKQAMGFGKSRAKLAPEHGTGVSFDDVAGCDEAKHDLKEMVEFLRNPSRFTALGARIPKGILLLGPPGTGKTLLARAVAGEADVPFFSISGSDFVEMFVGVGAARVRDLFLQAKEKAPCIVFIDEIDAVGRQRGVTMGMVNDEREQTLNQLLAEMDGFEVNSGVILLAATNRPEVLDRALLRPGRFDRQVILDAPDRSGREAILRVHARDKPMASDVDLGDVARATPGMSGADLANALNEAALGAAQLGRKDIRQSDIEDAVERVMAGPERRSRRLGKVEKRRVAFHESGHALVAAHCESADRVEKISIIPRGRAALGYTLQLPEQEQFLKTPIALRERIAVLLGGRAAEDLVLGEVSTGAQDDLQTATALARQMVCLFGLSERIGLATCARPSDGAFLQPTLGGMQRDCSEETAREIDEEVKRELDEAYEVARTILRDQRTLLDTVAAALLEREALSRDQFEALLVQSE